MVDDRKNLTGARRAGLLAIGVALLIAMALGYVNRIRLGLALGVLHEVEFADPQIEASIREQLRQPDAPLLLRDVETLGMLHFAPVVPPGGASASDLVRTMELGGIEHSRARELVLTFAEIDDLGPAGAMRRLTELDVPANRITDVSPLSDVTSLTTLTLADNDIRDIRPLRTLTNLRYLNAGARWWTTGSTGERHSSEGNEIVEVHALTDLTSLQVLLLDGNQVRDISALAGLLHIGEGETFGVRPFRPGQREGVTIHLGLSRNQIRDIGPLSRNEGIDAGDGVDLRDNPLDDDAYDVHIPTLQERGVNILFDPRP